MALLSLIKFSNIKSDHWFICSQLVLCGKIHGAVLMGILQGYEHNLENAAKRTKKWYPAFSTKTILLMILL